MDNDWIMEIENDVYMKIFIDFPYDKKVAYGLTTLANFSTDNISDTPSTFPFVRIFLLPASEQGSDLKATTINAGLFTFQVDVFYNKGDKLEKYIMAEIVKIMKKMRFEVIAMPSFEMSGNVRRSTARFRRYIGRGETYK